MIFVKIRIKPVLRKCFLCFARSMVFEETLAGDQSKFNLDLLG